MTEAEEKIYIRGQRGVYRSLLSTALRGLDVDDAPDDLAVAQLRIARLEAHLADARVQLRMLCDDFGDNDWEDDDHLGDVIDKHLGKHLYETASETTTETAPISNDELSEVARAGEGPATAKGAEAYRTAIAALSAIASELLARRTAGA